jgi:carbon monoxide dehydrogenase subunit G
MGPARAPPDHRVAAQVGTSLQGPEGWQFRPPHDATVADGNETVRRDPFVYARARMEIRNVAHIAAPATHVWDSVTDVEAIVPCIPGATLTERLAEDRYAGEFRVKVGPLGLTLGGEVTIAETDQAERRMRMHVAARDRRGMGQVEAEVVLTVTGDDTAADLEIVADTALRGPVAQFGRPAIISAIGSRILGEFARCLETRLASPAAG